MVEIDNAVVIPASLIASVCFDGGRIFIILRNGQVVYGDENSEYALIDKWNY